MATEIELIKPAEFARRQQVSRMAITKAMQDGRLQEAIVEQDGRKWLDAAVATQIWDDRRQVNIALAGKPPSKHAQHPVKPPRKSPAKTAPAAAAGDDAEPEQPSTAQGLPPLGPAVYNQARAVREQYQARLARLEYEEKSGRLIATEQVRIAQFKQGQRVREAVLAIPDRLAPALAAALGVEVDPGAVYNVMQTELRNILQEITQGGRGDR